MARKRSTTRKTAKRSKKTTRSKTTKTKTLKKRFAPKPPLPAKGRAKGSRKSMQPKTKPSRSANPVDQALVIAKKRYKPETQKSQDKKKKAKWNKFKTVARKQKLLAINLIKDTGKVLDKAGAYAEKIAPGVTAFAAENPENPYLAAFAGGVDAAAGMHAFVNDAVDAMQKGHHDRQGIKSLTDTNKYQKMMITDDSDIPMFGPEDIDLPPKEDPAPLPMIVGMDDDL